MFTLKERSVSNTDFQRPKNLIEEKADLVFVPTLEDFPQAIRPFPQTRDITEIATAYKSPQIYSIPSVVSS